jgi:hypothetical protein
MARLTNGGIVGKAVNTPDSVSVVGKWNLSDQHIYKQQNLWTGSIVESGLVLNLDASLQKSYNANRNFVSAKIYPSFSGLRSANYTVQYSDDNSTWTTAWSGIASNNSSCTVQINSGNGDGSYGSHRYWRYVEGSAVVNHHPRVSRISLVDINGNEFNIVVYAADNCSDSGTYQVGTVAYDCSVNWNDITSNKKDAIFLNGPVYNSTSGGYIDFDGSNDYAVFNNVVIPNSTSAYSVSTWIRRASNSGYQEILSQWSNATSSNAFFFGFDGSNVRFTDNWTSISVSGAGNTNVWINLVAVYSVSNAYIYLNNTLSATKGSGFSYTGTGNLFMGRQGELSSEYFNGDIGSVLVYNKALTAQEVSQNFNSTRGRYGI